MAEEYISDDKGRRIKRSEDKDARPLWQKHIGGGTLRLTTGYRVKYGEKFRAFEDQIPLAGREQVKKIDDGYDPTEGKAEQEAVENEPTDEGKFYMEHRGGPWWDVKSPEGRVMNNKALKMNDAEKYRDQLNGVED